MLWALAHFVAQSEFIAAVGLQAYLYDPYNYIEVLATILTLGASILGVCNEIDWYEGPAAYEAYLQQSVSNITGRQLARARGGGAGGSGDSIGTSAGMSTTSLEDDFGALFQNNEGSFSFMAWASDTSSLER